MAHVAPTDGRHQRADGEVGVTAPWVRRTAAAWLLGAPLGVAPEDRAALEAEAEALVREAAARVPQ
jgi:hypothetical protein